MLSDHSLGPLSNFDLNRPVAAFAVQGAWDWASLNQSLHENVCNIIASIRAPSPGSEDLPVRLHSADGLFSIKSTYSLLHDGELVHPNSDFPFGLIWKLRTPPSVNTFVWKVAHHRLMNNSERHSRGISGSGLCPRCHTYPESILHLLCNTIYPKRILHHITKNFEIT